MQKRRWCARRTSASVLGFAYMLGLAACAGEATEQGVSRVHQDLGVAAASPASLATGASCDELLGRLQSELLTQVSERAEQARISGAAYYGGGVFIDDVAPVLGNPLLVPVAAPAAATTSGFSDTTPQVAGVDEADIVKTEGDRIYLIHGTSLFVLNAASSAATEIVAELPIEGEAAELFVRDGQIVVFSRFYGPIPGVEDPYSPYYYYYPTYTKLTLIDAASPTFDVQREAYLEGSYYFARRHDGVVRGILQQNGKAQLDYPSVSYVDIFGHPRSQAEIDLQVDLWVLLSTESIEDSVIEDYLPRRYERVGGELVEQPLDCAAFLSPGPGLTQAGGTSVVTLDLAAPAAPLETLTLLGYSDAVYIGTESLIMRQTEYSNLNDPLPIATTELHRFALSGADTTYTASGSMDGYIQGVPGIDELDGVIRAATAEDLYGIDGDAGGGYIYLGTSSRVVTLSVGAEALTELGRSPDFGPQEYIYAALFVGDRGYVQTYGQASRLTAVDLSDPAAPALGGQAVTPGYTIFLYPISSSALLGIGQGADVNGFIQNTALQLFDVSDASAPSLADEYVYTEDGYYASIGDARSLSFNRRRNLLAFPIQNYNTGVSSLEVFGVSLADGFNRLGSLVPPAQDPTLLECLQFFGYPTDPESVEQLDPALIESLLQECRIYNQNYVQRGLFRGDDVYAISSLSVSAYSLDALAGPPLSQLPLPSPFFFSIPLAAVEPIPAGISPDGIQGSGSASE